MTCRSTYGNSAVTSYTRVANGLLDEQMQSLFHGLHRDGRQRAIPMPTRQEVIEFLDDLDRRIRHDPTLTESRRASLLARSHDARDDVLPNGPTFYAWQNSASAALMRDLFPEPPLGEPRLGLPRLGYDRQGYGLTQTVFAHDGFGANASAADPLIDPDHDPARNTPRYYHDVVIHGNEESLGVYTTPAHDEGDQEIDVRDAALAVQGNPHYRPGQKVRLVACNTGEYSGAVAQRLADVMGVEVLAPTETVWAYPHGDLKVTDSVSGNGPETGTWVTFEPRKAAV